MESIAPPLQLLISVRNQLEMGYSIRSGINYFISNYKNDFQEVIASWLIAREHEQKLCTKNLSIYRVHLISILDRGLSGESIYKPLCELELEIIEACEHEMALKISRLPFLLLIPLLLLQFPAFLILLFGPILKNLFYSF